MAPIVDPAILKALSLDQATTTISKHGGSGFAETFKVSGMIDGKRRLFFVKTGGRNSEEMFTGMIAYIFLDLILFNVLYAIPS